MTTNTRPSRFILLSALFLNFFIFFGCTGAETPAEGSTASPTGELWIDVSDVLGRNLPGKIELYSPGAPAPVFIRLRKGQGLQQCPVGDYRAHVYVFDWHLPVLVDIQDVAIREGKTADLLVTLVEGTAGDKKPRHFDRDEDSVMDRVELAAGTDPADAADYPECRPVAFESPVLDDKPGWYRGELHARSRHGGGTETAAELVKRAEQEGLDFLAIADRNTMAVCGEPGYQSNKVVLIPALEWGDDDNGVALIYGPRTFPPPAQSVFDVHGTCRRVQAQGGVFVIAHPCFSSAPWQWGSMRANGIEVWCRDWRHVPPITLDQYNQELQRRREGRLVHSIARAASTPGLSANGQAALFWDYELVARGIKMSPIAGSYSSSPEVPLGRPITYVYAAEKSARAILDGIRAGQVYVSSGPDGPTLDFAADVLRDGRMDVRMGGIIPTDVRVDLYVEVKNAVGAKVELLLNGRPIDSKRIEAKKAKQVFTLKHGELPSSYAVYRARVVRTPTEEGFGLMEVLALSSPIYAQPMLIINPDRVKPEDMWIRLETENLPGMQVTGTVEEDGKVWVKTEGERVIPLEAEEWVPPEDIPAVPKSRH